MAGSEPTPGGRLSLGKAVGQGWALWLAGFLAVAGGVSLLVNPGADLRLIRWLVGLFLAGWGVLRLVQVARASRRDRTWLVLSGAAAAGAGIVVLAWPAITETVLVFILVVGGLSLAAVDLLILWGATTLGEAYQSPIRDNAYRRELDLEVRRII